jgi:L-ascorbate metabolism protein UlaG (beta-lactamase superfamily)
MKITKYNQSCLLIETRGKRILVDPGNIGFTEEMVEKDWKNIDIILVTHKHNDHCLDDAINKIVARDDAKVYTTNEVVKAHKLSNVSIVKEGDIFDIDDIKIEVTKAVHGFLTIMKINRAVVNENVGFIIDDGNTSLYTTSDTINFYNNYKCDVLCMPFNGNGLTMGLMDSMGFIKDINPKIVLPVHTQHPNPKMNPDIDLLKETLERENMNYKILNVGESLLV